MKLSPNSNSLVLYFLQKHIVAYLAKYFFFFKYKHKFKLLHYPTNI